MTLDFITELLDCYSHQAHCSPHITRKQYSRPILLQHFPLYRQSDINCTEPDEAPYPEKIEKYKEKWDCLGKNATEQLIRQIKPRLAVSGHSHHGCTRSLPSNNGIEITLPSFNWRNKINPSYGLFVATPDEYVFYKCLMPVETTVFAIYIIGFLFLPLWFYYLHSKQFRKRINGCVCKYFPSR
ncbi:metallophosphoesterase 1 isoform X2 [Agrilus planipennis]|uniref:Metallophosphoesterase 1 isoform X2 n=1 Tax=Agrilus planipennis TaxID=224129 RepID=A0A1W4WYH1_AGRPL|nr:metallophosphoesterase 1 isoform X2 [Agrilus planipennis]